LLNGIQSIVFMPQGNGSLREIGFNNPGDAHLYYSQKVSSAPMLRNPLELPRGRGGRLDDITPWSESSSNRSPSLETPGKMRTCEDGGLAIQDIPRTRSSSPESSFARLTSSDSSSAGACDPPHSTLPQPTAAPPIVAAPPVALYNRRMAQGFDVNVQDSECSMLAKSFFCSAFGISVGSQGHPTSCGPPCKYHGRPKGCKDGFACTHCHLCHRSGKTKRCQPDTAKVESWPNVESYRSLAFCGPSLGSKGHPMSCGQACKYYWQSKGCKDGLLCTHCHLCPWVDPRKRVGRI
jgi:hypothetical protein